MDRETMSPALPYSQKGGMELSVGCLVVGFSTAKVM